MMRRRSWIELVTVTFCLAAASALAGETIYLVSGQGIKGGLQIGAAGQVKDRWNEVPFRNKEDKDLTYRTNEARQVVAIRCRKPDCVTDQGIRIGMSEKKVLRRYGAPRKESLTSNGVYYEYLGIGFEIENAAVAVIYVYARAPR